MPVKSVSSTSPLPQIRSVPPSWVILAAKITAATMTIVAALYTVYTIRKRLYTPRTSIESKPIDPPTIQPQPPNSFQTPNKSAPAAESSILASPRLSTLKERLLKSPKPTPPAKRNLFPANSSKTPQKSQNSPATPQTPFIINSPRALTPRSLYRFYASRKDAKSQTSIRDKPIVIKENNQEFVITEEVLNSLKNFFKNYSPETQWSEGNPYLLCDLLERHPVICSNRKEAFEIDELLKSFAEKREKHLEKTPSPFTSFLKLTAPIIVKDDKTEYTITEDVLVSLESFFENFDINQKWGKDNPYILCNLLELKPEIYSQMKEAARIERLITLFERRREEYLEIPNNPFYAVHPVTVEQFFAVNTFLDDYLNLADKETQIYWMTNYYESRGDPLFWCYQLEKRLTPPPTRGILREILDKYHRVREEIFEEPELAKFFFIDPFEVTMTHHTNIRTIYIINAELLLEMKHLFRSMQNKNIENIYDQNQNSFLNFSHICDALIENPDSYHSRPESDIQLMDSVIQLYRASLQHLNHSKRRKAQQFMHLVAKNLPFSKPSTIESSNPPSTLVDEAQEIRTQINQDEER